jgi:DNA modification methylase
MQRNRASLQSNITSQDQSELSIIDEPHPKNTLNDMSGERFLYFTKSVLSTSYPSVYSHELRKKHGANKPPQLMALLIEFFTKTGMSVLDPLAGESIISR